VSLNKILTIVSIVVAGLLAVVFAADLALGVPFQRAALVLDIAVLIACALILWQGAETYFEMKR